MREFDSSAWTGRSPTRWWQKVFRTRYVLVAFGNCLLRNAFGVELMWGRVRSPAEGCRRYHYARFWRLA